MLIAIDQNTINIGRGRTAFLSATALLDRLAPEDRVGVVAFPRGPRLEFTADRKAVDDTLQQVIGTAQHTLNEVQLSPTEVLSITRGDNRYLDPVIDRECQFAFATRRRSPLAPAGDGELPVQGRTGGALARHPAPRADDGLAQHAAGDRDAAQAHSGAEDARLGLAGHARG